MDVPVCAVSGTGLPALSSTVHSYVRASPAAASGSLEAEPSRVRGALHSCVALVLGETTAVGGELQLSGVVRVAMVDEESPAAKGQEHAQRELTDACWQVRW